MIGTFLISSPVFLVDPSIAEVPENIWDRLIYGLKFSLTGIAIVFIVLMIIMVIIKLFELFFYYIPNRAKKKKEEREELSPVRVSQDDDSEVAAVIAAAVHAYYSDRKGPHKKYVIKSYRRI